MTNRYAANTEVSADRSKSEIERTLTHYGASAFMYAWDGPKAAISFRFKERYFRLELAMPDRNDREFIHTPTGKVRDRDTAFKAGSKLTARGGAPWPCISRPPWRRSSRGSSPWTRG